MTDNTPQATKNTTPCIGCGGSGQTSYFGGASRFMFTWEDCPDCHGTGITLDEPPSRDQVIPPSTSANKNS